MPHELARKCLTELEHFTYRFGPPPFITPESTTAIDAGSHHRAGSSPGRSTPKAWTEYARLEGHPDAARGSQRLNALSF